MTDYRIVCTEQQPCGSNAHRAHIVAVGVGSDPDQANERLTLEEVIRKMPLGDRFYTVGQRSGKRANVETFKCAYCSKTHIKSTADAVTDNNLDELRFCHFKAS